MWLFIVANSGVQYRYHYHGVARVVGVLSMVVVEAEIEILEVALDFVVVRSNGKWEPYAIEINLRKGGTTHPFLTLQFLQTAATTLTLPFSLRPMGGKSFLLPAIMSSHRRIER